MKFRFEWDPEASVLPQLVSLLELLQLLWNLKGVAPVGPKGWRQLLCYKPHISDHCRKESFLEVVRTFQIHFPFIVFKDTKTHTHNNPLPTSSQWDWVRWLNSSPALELLILKSLAFWKNVSCSDLWWCPSYFGGRWILRSIQACFSPFFTTSANQPAEICTQLLEESSQTPVNCSPSATWFA